MIAIVNVSKKLTKSGPHQYEIRINTRPVTTFTHNRQDPLSVCLLKASKAALKAETLAAVDLFSKVAQEALERAGRN